MDETPLKVLLVEDDEDDFIITREYLSEIPTRTFQLDRVADYESGRAAMAEQKHDLYLIDYRLGAHSGIELLQEAIAHNCPAPIILLTGVGDRSTDQAAMKAGAADYLIKGQINAQTLERSIFHSLQRKEAERKLRASEERLRLSQKLESVGTLAGGVAHDFNNLLTIISAYAGRLHERSLAPEQVDKIATSIEQTVQRGAALVKQILTFARETEVEFAIVQLNGVIDAWVKMLEETFPRSVRFVRNLSADVPTIMADVTQLNQILLNLCVNSRDAMNGKGTITISTSTVSGQSMRERGVDVTADRYALLEVSDTGCGMDEETKKRIFDPFFTTKGKDHGTGLGMAVVYGIVRSHHAHIELQSAPGAGATFRIFFPAATPLRNN